MDRDALARCSVADLADTIGQLHGIACAAHRHLLSMVAELDRREAYRDDGAADVVSWLTAKLSLSQATARVWVDVARALDELPHIASEYEAGRLSFDQVRALCDIAISETDAELAAYGAGSSVAHLELLARRSRRRSADAATADHDARSLRWWWENGRTTMRLSGRLPADQGAVVETALERIMETLPPDPAGGYGPPRIRAVDALVELASQRVAEDYDADRATVIAHVDASVLAGGDGAAELDGGAVITAATARRLACDARVQTVVHGGDGTPIGIGRLSRTVPPWLARQVRHRDPTCRFPGCHRTRATAAHHIAFWGRDSGRTDLDNLVRLCRYHHRLVHEDGWSVRGDPAGVLTFLRPNGTLYSPGPPALRPEVRRRLFPDDGDDGDDGEAEAC
jgi:hypothetical protein